MTIEISPSSAGSFLDNVLADDRAFVVETYLSDTPLQMRTMREALANGDLQMVGRAARTLRSSSERVGATAVAQLARKLHVVTGYRASPNDVAPLLARLEAAFIAVAPLLLEILSQTVFPAAEPRTAKAG